MLNNLEREIFLFGNIELHFSLKEIKNINLKDLKNLHQDYSEGWPWRFYKNFKSLLSTREYDIVNNQDSFIEFLFLLEEIIKNCVKNQKIKLNYIDIENENHYLIVFYAIINDISFKLKSYADHTNIVNIEKIFNKIFKDYIPFIENKNIILDYVSPFEGNSWSSSWKLIYGNSEIKLRNIDVFTDIYFYNQNIYYNASMYENLIFLVKRLNYLKENANLYYEKIIKIKLKNLTTKLYNIFPIKLIYKDYKELINIDKEVYIPELYNICEKNNISWFFSILPIYLTGYILGFPIINSDVPSPKNIKQYIEKFCLLGHEKYYDYISEKNKKILDLSVFEIPCGNTIENNEILDLTLTKVTYYNMDDIVIFFNVGVYHVFTPPEFPNLVKKEVNPYNRQPIPVFNNILENMRFRKKVTRYLSNRGVNIKLNSTLKENYELLLEKLNNEEMENCQREDVNTGMDIFNSSFINFLINSYNIH